MGELSQEAAAQHPFLAIVGLVGSIDNDFSGTDMTIGADTALHRITAALDQIGSTASSHQRTFVVEVMGRNCGYLALMSSLAGTAHWVFMPESPPETDDWETLMCDVLAAGRAAGRRHSMVVIAEGARDRNGNPITSDRVSKVLEERLGEDARVTILGHIQRGGAPSAFDRWMSTLVGKRRGGRTAQRLARGGTTADWYALQPDHPHAVDGMRPEDPRCRRSHWPA